MKYESVILKRLIDTYGVVGNPQYISEIIKEFIIQGKECYPDLFTYQSDWLAHIDEFGLNPSYTVTYTGQSIYAPNTLEKPVKSAILKGNTGYRDIDTGEILETFEEGRNLELVSVKMPVLTTTGKNLFDIDSVSIKGNVVIKNSTITITPNGTWQNQAITTISVNCGETYVLRFNNGVDNSNTGSIKIYDVESVENILICQSTSGASGGKFLKFTPNTNKIKVVIEQYGSDGIFIMSDIQIEKGSVATSYEPFKSNILTVNEDVELGSVGEIKDELNLLTGEITSYSYNYTITGDEPWTDWANDLGEYVTFYFYYKNSNMPNIPNEKVGKGICNKFKVVGNVYNSQQRAIGIGAEYLSLGIKFSELNITSDSTRSERVNALKTWLKNNNVEIRLPYAQEVVKTVDLTILDQNGQNVKQLMSFNGGTHFNTMSTEGSPLPSISVSVETDLEETLMMCSLEGNTL